MQIISNVSIITVNYCFRSVMQIISTTQTLLIYIQNLYIVSYWFLVVGYEKGKEIKDKVR